MPATPKRAGRTPRPGTRFLADVLAENIRGFRSLRQLSQEDLAARMRVLGHDWVRPTVSTIERAQRNVTVDELLGLALILDAGFGDLLSPRGPAREREAAPLDVGVGTPMTSELAEYLIRGWARAAITFNAKGQPTGWKYSPPTEAPGDLAVLEGVMKATGAAKTRRKAQE